MHEDLFAPRDLLQMDELGISPKEAARQVELFRNPPPYTRVLRPCLPGDGIRSLDESDHPRLLALFEKAARQGRAAKFVPASGAATRMFKALLAELHDEDTEDSEESEPSPTVRTFLDNLPRFAFHDALAEVMARDGLRLDEADPRTILDYLLTERGLGYAELPKGLLLFHRYPDDPAGHRTPFDEHLVEAAALTRDDSGVCRLHFTVSPRHQPEFESRLAAVRPWLEERYNARFEVSFSEQRRSTDTIAVDPENRPFRQEDGSLLFRPGGHGSLIENLDDLARDGWDLVFLKNIDNVVPDHGKPLIHFWKQLLAGCLVSLQERAFYLLDCLSEPAGQPEGEADAALLDEAARFLEEELSRPLPARFRQWGAAKRRRFLISALDRPLRVCGLVRNHGEPGGGPFWVESPSGGVSPQIVETPQIDLDSPDQRAALEASTHFSPVDIVCGLLGRHGRPYDLTRYIDPSTVFIASKSHEGRPLKALERPGLWNGAMAGWNTVFVEVPDATFAPVKTVLDLLRPEHQ
jgi:hypothetical protein